MQSGLTQALPGEACLHDRPTGRASEPRAASPPATLASLRPGEKVVITSIDCREPAVQRLMVLGLVIGAEMQYAGAAIGGDPLEFRLHGSGISLRRAEAEHFGVSAASGD